MPESAVNNDGFNHITRSRGFSRCTPTSQNHKIFSETMKKNEIVADDWCARGAVFKEKINIRGFFHHRWQRFFSLPA
jgi:hypothetical protein